MKGCDRHMNQHMDPRAAQRTALQSSRGANKTKESISNTGKEILLVYSYSRLMNPTAGPWALCMDFSHSNLSITPSRCFSSHHSRWLPQPSPLSTTAPEWVKLCVGRRLKQPFFSTRLRMLRHAMETTGSNTWEAVNQHENIPAGDQYVHPGCVFKAAM